MTTALHRTREKAGYEAGDLRIFKEFSKTSEYGVRGRERLKQKMVTYWLAELREPNKEPKLSRKHTEYRWSNKDDSIAFAGFKELAEILNYFDEVLLLI